MIRSTKKAPTDIGANKINLLKLYHMKGIKKMLSNLLMFILFIVAIVVIGLVLGILFSLYGVIHLKMKQLSLRIEHDPMNNPIRN